ncbi:hypothetical protein [Pedobacter terrae]|uniref:hypothetical protein n=1 Tax=Pedobacter terrae TaxID=405671 RepID=UPI002FF96E28
MSKEEFEKIDQSLNAVEELNQNWAEIHEKLGEILTTGNFKDITDGFVNQTELYVLIDQNITDKKLLHGSSSISLFLVQFVFIHYYLANGKNNPESLEAVKNFVNDFPMLKSILGDWSGYYKVVIYQDYFKKHSWNDYVKSSTWAWNEINLLDHSILNCKVSFETVLEYLTSIVTKHPNDYGVPRVGKNIILKMELDGLFKREVENNIETIISIESASVFLLSFLRGMIVSRTDFEKWFKLLSKQYPKGKAFKILYALGVACPTEQSCQEELKQEIDNTLATGNISSAECVQLYSIKNFKSEDILDYLIKLSATSVSQEDTNALIHFLLNNLDSDIDSDWFRKILFNIVKIDDEKNLGILNNLFYSLIEKDIKFAYELIEARYELLGPKSFLTDHWHELVIADKDLFSAKLTQWLNSDVTNIHWALLKLCTINEISPSDFKINATIFRSLALRDKLYIAIKIIGFIYSKDHLQSLMFSLVEYVEQSETILIDNLFRFFYNYVIYNYRTSLDTIKDILKAKELPSHLLKFYDDLDKSYYQYFKDLGIIKDLPELYPDSRLVQHIQFYTQSHFAEKSKDIGKTGFAALFKNTPVHSHRWAIRQDDDSIHAPKSLGYFKTSMEFPSGERLNPIYQETMRRTYQRMKRDEIDIN